MIDIASGEVEDRTPSPKPARGRAGGLKVVLLGRTHLIVKRVGRSLESGSRTMGEETIVGFANNKSAIT